MSARFENEQPVVSLERIERLEHERDKARADLASLREQYDKVLASATASARAIGVLLEERAGLYATAVLARDFDGLGISAEALRQQASRSLERPVDMSWWTDGDPS